jgi:hypothetical protein
MECSNSKGNKVSLPHSKRRVATTANFRGWVCSTASQLTPGGGHRWLRTCVQFSGLPLWGRRKFCHQRMEVPTQRTRAGHHLMGPSELPLQMQQNLRDTQHNLVGSLVPPSKPLLAWNLWDVWCHPAGSPVPWNLWNSHCRLAGSPGSCPSDCYSLQSSSPSPLTYAPHGPAPLLSMGCKYHLAQPDTGH